MQEDAQKAWKDSPIYTMESALITILAQMEHRGVRVDKSKLQQVWQNILCDMERLEREIYLLAGETLNINSPKQIQVLLFEKLWIKPTKKNKTGYSVDNEVLEEIAQSHEIARLILEYRTLAKLDGTYIRWLVPYIDQTGYIHTSYDSLGAATGRMSSTDPNLQNIPTGIGYAHDIKSCFIPSEGNIFIVADYSQIELRVLALMSQDAGLLEAFEQGEDIHMRTARYIFPDREITSEERRIAKTVNFWVIYGITGFWLSKTLGCTPWEATEYIGAFYARYPRVRAYYDEILSDARDVGYVETYFGRKRFVPWVSDANKTIRSIAEREAINMPIQWTAADILKYAMLALDAKIRENNLRWAMILQVHDELVFDVPVDEGDIFTRIIRETMEGVLMNHVWITNNESRITNHELRFPPIRVDIHSGKDWVSAKG